MNPLVGDLNTFEIIFELASISKAAEVLDKNQGNLSRALQRLEKNLNEKLFTRYRGGVKPTLKAEQLYNSLVRMRAIWDNMREGLSEHTGPAIVKIGAHQSLANAYLGGILERLCVVATNAYPKITFSSSLEVTRKVQIRELDLGIVANPVKSEDLVVKPLCREKILLCSSGKSLEPDLLFKNPKMLHIHKLIKRVKAKKVVDIDDYDVAASICSKSVNFACIIPSSVALRYRLNVLSELKNKIDVKLITYPGSFLAGNLKDLQAK